MTADGEQQAVLLDVLDLPGGTADIQSAAIAEALVCRGLGELPYLFVCTDSTNVNAGEISGNVVQLGTRLTAAKRAAAAARAAAGGAEGAAPDVLPETLTIFIPCLMHIMHNTLKHAMMAWGADGDKQRTDTNSRLAHTLEALSSWAEDQKLKLASFDIAHKCPEPTTTRFNGYTYPATWLVRWYPRVVEMAAAYVKGKGGIRGVKEPWRKLFEELLKPEFLLQCSTLACWGAYMGTYDFNWVEDRGGFRMRDIHARVRRIDGLVAQAVHCPEEVFAPVYTLAGQLRYDDVWGTVVRPFLSTWVNYHITNTAYLSEPPFCLAALADDEHGQAAAADLVATIESGGRKGAKAAQRRVAELVRKVEATGISAIIVDVRTYAETGVRPDSLTVWIVRVLLGLPLSNHLSENAVHISKAVHHNAKPLLRAAIAKLLHDQPYQRHKFVATQLTAAKKVVDAREAPFRAQTARQKAARDEALGQATAAGSADTAIPAVVAGEDRAQAARRRELARSLMPAVSMGPSEGTAALQAALVQQEPKGKGKRKAEGGDDSAAGQGAGRGRGRGRAGRGAGRSGNGQGGGGRGGGGRGSKRRRLSIGSDSEEEEGYYSAHDTDDEEGGGAKGRGKGRGRGQGRGQGVITSGDGGEGQEQQGAGAGACVEAGGGSGGQEQQGAGAGACVEAGGGSEGQEQQGAGAGACVEAGGGSEGQEQQGAGAGACVEAGGGGGSNSTEEEAVSNESIVAGFVKAQEELAAKQMEGAFHLQQVTELANRPPGYTGAVLAALLMELRRQLSVGAGAALTEQAPNGMAEPLQPMQWPTYSVVTGAILPHPGGPT